VRCCSSLALYGVLGGYVGIDLPITIEPKPPCTPNITMGVSVRAGIEAGLLGVGDSDRQHGLGFEAGASVLGPYTLQASRCPN
jgi:hypothetical protein